MADMGRMGAVGAGAVAKKSDTDLAGKKTLTNVSIEPADNGGFVIRQSYEREPAKGSKANYSDTYVKPETIVCESVPGLLQHIQQLFGEGGEGRAMKARRPMPAPAGGGMPMPAPVPG